MSLLESLEQVAQNPFFQYEQFEQSFASDDLAKLIAKEFGSGPRQASETHVAIV